MSAKRQRRRERFALGRITKDSNLVSIGFLYDGANIVQEQADLGNADILAGGIDELFTRADPSSIATSIADGLGNVVALTDAAGLVRTEYVHEPFGKTETRGDLSGNTSQYTGRENDGTGLYYYRARYYSPSLQRFISEDPIGIASGDVNLYSYVANDPTNSSDPSGLERLHPQGGTWPGPVAPPLGGRKPLHEQIANGIYLAGQFWNQVKIEQKAKGNMAAAAGAGLLSELCGGPGYLDTPYLGGPIDAGMPISPVGAGAGANRLRELVGEAQEKYPKLAGKINEHHIDPKYLGGDPKGRTVPLDAAYHQQITNEFRRLHPYAAARPTASQLREILRQVYDKYPLP